MPVSGTCAAANPASDNGHTPAVVRQQVLLCQALHLLLVERHQLIQLGHLGLQCLGVSKRALCQVTGSAKTIGESLVKQGAAVVVSRYRDAPMTH